MQQLWVCSRASSTSKGLAIQAAVKIIWYSNIANENMTILYDSQAAIRLSGLQCNELQGGLQLSEIPEQDSMGV